MKATQVSIRATEIAAAAGRPSLTPELLAAVGARYSRNNEGLEAILAKIDPDNLDKSVDSIFRMIDYGHQSIADMTPVAMFVDGISILLAYLVWSWCPTAGGQESSTRYIRLDRDGLVDPGLLGVPTEKQAEWYAFIERCFDAYAESLAFWEEVGERYPDLAQIPAALVRDSGDKAQKQVTRMRRNYAFDRARYFLPVGAKTNMMLIMSARGWVQLCQNLHSHWLPEARELGLHLSSELGLAAPRMVKHAQAKLSYQHGFANELQHLTVVAKRTRGASAAECESKIGLFLPEGIEECNLVDALKWHDNRYAFVGSALCRTSVRFSWSAVAFAEIRDLNRHRTGYKYSTMIPVGFYYAADQVPTDNHLDKTLGMLGDDSIREVKSLLSEGSAGFVGWLLLGSQFSFEHTTTLDKFIYEAELRTGPGAHFRYATHLRDAVAALRVQFPRLAESIHLGLSEPE